MDPKPGPSSAVSVGNNMNIASSPDIDTVTRDCLSMQVDCVGWNRLHKLLAVGGYQLKEGDSSLRVGLLYLIDFTSKSPSIIQEDPLPGVLDLKWEPTGNRDLVVATSNSIVMFQLCKDETGVFSLVRQFTYFLDTLRNSFLMALYVEWIAPTEVIYSDTIGGISMLGIVTESTDEDDVIASLNSVKIKAEPGTQHVTNYDDRPKRLKQIDRANLHDSFIWVVHFDPDSEIFYTGADDGIFVAFHKRNFHNKDFRLIKRFPVGVTSINTIDDIVAVGSYDDMLRIYTVTMFGQIERKISLTQRTEINLGGTVWRTVWLTDLTEIQGDGNDVDNVQYKIAVAAARNGIHMLSLQRSSWKWSRHASCLDYEGALAYGIDVKENVEEKSYTVATCYFDNNTLHVWKTKAF